MRPCPSKTCKMQQCRLRSLEISATSRLWCRALWFSVGHVFFVFIFIFLLLFFGLVAEVAPRSRCASGPLAIARAEYSVVVKSCPVRERDVGRWVEGTPPVPPVGSMGRWVEGTSVDGSMGRGVSQRCEGRNLKSCWIFQKSVRPPQQRTDHYR